MLSWSLTEVVRYSFYACSLLGREPPVLLFLRYTLFYTLYPSGASSEALLIYTTLPKPALGLHADLHANVREVLFAIWWPGACAFVSLCFVLFRSVSWLSWFSWLSETSWAWAWCADLRSLFQGCM